MSTAAGPARTDRQPQRSPARGRGQQTAADMLRSMLLVLAGVLALVLLAPRPEPPVREPVDVAAVAQQVDPGSPAVVPDLPDGWSANAARLAPLHGDGLPTWHVGYVTPSGRYAGLEVAEDVTPRWLAQVTSEGVDVGWQDVGGHRWRQLVSPDGDRHSLVLQLDEVTTVVTGTALLDELALLARAAVPG